ncbi:hypothetical protein Patl1_26241 [Pistacia atlantica]|uniref:Uncharacterized protein n=1 Tax=Pistacia atlantica TaxID=434234 RepID=A0ACC1B4G0_9ROSI|nr:hypothetical protein Patl1_26241 [Pistacia atlantica]
MDQLGIKLNVASSKSEPGRPTGKQRFKFEIGREMAHASTNKKKVQSHSVQISWVNICSVSVSSFNSIQVFSLFHTIVELGKSGSICQKRSHLSLNGSQPSSFIGRNLKVGAAKCPDPEFIENGVLSTGQEMVRAQEVKQTQPKDKSIPTSFSIPDSIFTFPE